MNAQEAQQLLKKPVFGDEQCIAALRVAWLVQKLKVLRSEWADEPGLEVLAGIYKQRPIPEPENLTAGQIEFEINFWKAVEERYL
jgi:hypothetical protein